MLKWFVVVKFHGVLNRLCSVLYGPRLNILFTSFFFFLSTSKTMCFGFFTALKLLRLCDGGLNFLISIWLCERFCLVNFTPDWELRCFYYTHPETGGSLLQSFPEFSSIFPHFTRLFRLFSSSDCRRGLKTIRLWIEMVEIMEVYRWKITTGAIKTFSFFP